MFQIQDKRKKKPHRTGNERRLLKMQSSFIDLKRQKTAVSPIIDALALSLDVTNPNAMPDITSTFQASPNVPHVKNLPTNRQQRLEYPPPATSHMTLPRPRAHSSPKPRYSNPALTLRNTMIIGGPLTSNRSRICIIDFLGRPKSSHCSYSPTIIIASSTTDLATLISLYS